MAVMTLGAAAPASTPSINPTPALVHASASAPRTLYRVPASTRTRRLAGVCVAADALVSVYRSRQGGGNGDGNSVALVLQDAAGERQAGLSAAQAHALGAALMHAAVQEGGAQ